MPNLGPTELIIILLIVVLLFGARKIPEIAKGLGKGIKDFKSAMKDEDKSDAKKPDDTDAPKSST
jgi:sec-independent protein translocase protein TatA